MLRMRVPHRPHPRETEALRREPADPWVSLLDCRGRSGRTFGHEAFAMVSQTSLHGKSDFLRPCFSKRHSWQEHLKGIPGDPDHRFEPGVCPVFARPPVVSCPLGPCSEARARPVFGRGPCRGCPPELAAVQTAHRLLRTGIDIGIQHRPAPAAGLFCYPWRYPEADFGAHSTRYKRQNSLYLQSIVRRD